MKKEKNSFGNNISFAQGETWRFNNEVAKNFDQHVVSSIPHYNALQKYIANISEWFLTENSTIYDIGCSTSNTSYEISKKNEKIKKLNFLCIDSSKQMLEISKKKLKLLKHNYKFLKKDINKIKTFNKHDLCLCVLLLPFLKNQKKLPLLKKIQKSLNSGGALLIVDKIHSDLSISENIFNQIYHDFKLNFFSKTQIWNKAKSLRSSMKLNTNSQNIELFKKSGFKRYEVFFRWFNFCGYIVFK
tara:strand:- start:25819 stop:26550 length:732 start_codon:yes stop_codon:yes gene_type:complete